MANKLKNWSTTPASNNQTPPLGWPEGMAPSAVNNTARQDRASLREWYEDAQWIDLNHTILNVAGQVVRYQGDVSAFYTSRRWVRLNGTNNVVVSSVAFNGPNLEVTYVGTVPGAVTQSEIHISQEYLSGIVGSGAAAGAVYVEPSTGDVRFDAAGSAARMRLLSAGQFVIGHSAAVAGATLTPAVQIHGASGNNSALGVTNWQGNATAGGTLSLGHARGGTIGTLTALQNGDTIGNLNFIGADATGTPVFQIAAQIQAAAGAAPAAGRVPGSLMFNVARTSDGALQTLLNLQNTQVRVHALGSDGAPELAGDSDVDTGIRWRGGNVLTICTAGNEVARFQAGGTAPQLLVQDGTNANPGYAFPSDLGTGMYRSGLNELAFATGTVQRLVVTNDGRLYGTALHNNAGAMTGITNQYIGSGTYTPTLTNVTNLAGSTASVMHWIRVGNVVTVAGQIGIDPTAAGAIELGISLPIASDFGAALRASGTAVAAASTECFAIRADSTNDRASLVGLAVDTTNHNIYVTFTYLVQ